MFQFLSAIVTVASLSSSLVAAPVRPASCAIESRPAAITNPADVEYPAVARAGGVTGTSVVRVDLSETGKLVGTSIAVSSGNKILDAAALRTAAKTEYSPEIRSCASVAGSYAVEVEFVN